MPLLHTNIAWRSDVEVKFANPSTWGGNWVKPPAWPRAIWELDNGYVNEDLVVWMRTAAFPKFRKPYRRVDHSSGSYFGASLPAGNYELDVSYGLLPASALASASASGDDLLSCVTPALLCALCSVQRTRWPRSKAASGSC